MVELLARDAVNAVAWLRQLGVAFDRTGDGALQLGREGGHDRPRIVHAAGMVSCAARRRSDRRSEEHTSELQSLMRISYAVFCLKKKKQDNTRQSKRY